MSEIEGSLAESFKDERLLNAVEEARLIQDWHSQNPHLRQQDLAARTGVSQPFISNRTRLLRLPPDVIRLIQTGAIQFADARDRLLPLMEDENEVRREAHQLASPAYHRSRSIEWATPSWLFNQLHFEFGFTIDLAASAENAKCTTFFTIADDALSQQWTGICWLNPPYGRDIESWIKKAHESALEGATVVCLAPARTDTSWWHKYVLPYAEIRYIQGRLRFGNKKGAAAPFPSAILIFRPGTTNHNIHSMRERNGN